MILNQDKIKFERKVSLGTAPWGRMLPKNPQDVLLLSSRNFHSSYKPAVRVRKFSSGYDVKKMKDVWYVGHISGKKQLLFGNGIAFIKPHIYHFYYSRCNMFCCFYKIRTCTSYVYNILVAASSNSSMNFFFRSFCVETRLTMRQVICGNDELSCNCIHFHHETKSRRALL